MKTRLQLASAFVLVSFAFALGWTLATGTFTKELPVFALWTVPLSVLIAFYNDRVVRQIKQAWRRFAAALGAGLLVFAYALVLNAMMAGYLRAFDFPAISFWVATAIGTGAIWRPEAPLIRSFVTAASASILFWVALFGIFQALSVATARHLSVIFAVHTAGPSSLKWASLDEQWKPLATEVTPVLAKHLSGTLEQTNCDSYNEGGPRAFAVIVLPSERDAIQHRTELIQPQRGTFVYFLKGGQWTRLELPNSEASWRTIVLEPRRPGASAPAYFLESSRGYLGRGLDVWGNRETCESANVDLR